MIIAKTLIGMENVAATRIKELDPNAKIQVSPQGFAGLLLIESQDEENLLRSINQSVVEVERAFKSVVECRADLKELSSRAAEAVRGLISPDETFAVRTTRRGRHEFTSVDVNVAVGAAIKEATGALVNLNNPDKVVAVEVVSDRAYVAVYPGSEEYKKFTPHKRPILKVLRRMSIVQMPYLGDERTSKTMGIRIGRAIQTFEVGELVIAFIGPVNAKQLRDFIDGVYEGIRTRYEIQRRVYGREVHKVPVMVQDLFQLVRERANENIVVFEPEGSYIGSISGKLRDLLLSGRRVNILVGSREGIPKGVFRFASAVVDLCPGVTIATDFAASSAIIALASLLQAEVEGQGT
ncbi:MAG: SPOUT family RNA methylase [Candidatus Nezhaarchaeota archaeon]|nr:SPOUT family RNA methylase [Candidatus Nezhaarchaeota archaeon]MCX8142497.1 SPOUT family RNA methylase [Candidatus Nezhaarchaeota archaeon]MDW8050530.1 SPOUT family RNA methylase [Nitrososphaerota archaeon]